MTKNELFEVDNFNQYFNIVNNAGIGAINKPVATNHINDYLLRWHKQHYGSAKKI